MSGAKGLLETVQALVELGSLAGAGVTDGRGDILGASLRGSVFGEVQVQSKTLEMVQLRKEMLVLPKHENAVGFMVMVIS